jgi:hypothetical protein
MVLWAAKGDENPGPGAFDEPRKGRPGGQPRTRGSALLSGVFDRAPHTFNSLLAVVQNRRGSPRMRIPYAQTTARSK